LTRAINYLQFECAHLFPNIFIILSEPLQCLTPHAESQIVNQTAFIVS